MVVLKKFVIPFGLLLVQQLAAAQFKVTFVVTLPVYQKPDDGVYLAGSFNNWNPGNENFVLKNVGDQQRITLELPKGRHEFKLTRGSWDKVECADGGKAIGNRVIALE